MPACGRSATTAASAELYRALVRVVPRRQVRAPGRHPDPAQQRRATRGSSSRGRHATPAAIVSYDVQVSTDGGAVDDVADEDEGDVRRLARRGRARLRVPGPGASTASGNAGQLERRRRPGTRRPRSRTGGFGRVVRTGSPTGRGPDTAAARLGHARRAARSSRSRAARSRRTASPGTRSREPIREWSPVSFVERGVWIAARSSTAAGQAVPGAQHAPSSTPGSGASTSGRGPRPASARAPPQLAVRAFSPNRDGSEDAHPAALDQHRRAGLADAAASTAPTGRWSGRGVRARRRRGRQAWDWNGAVGGTARQGRPIRAPARRHGRRPDLPRAVGAAR